MKLKVKKYKRKKRRAEDLENDLINLCPTLSLMFIRDYLQCVMKNEKSKI